MTAAASAAPHFVVDARRTGTTELVQVRGEVDIATAPLLRAVLDTVVGRRPTRVEVDLSAVVSAHVSRARAEAANATWEQTGPGQLVKELFGE